MTGEKKLEDLFSKELQAVLQELERDRRGIRNKLILFYPLLALSIIAGFFSFQNRPDYLLMVLAGMALLGASVTYFFYYSRRNKYVSRFKETVIRKIITLVDPSFTYSPEKWVGKEAYMKSGLFLESPDRCDGDDYVEGLYGQTAFCFSEVHTEKEENSGKDSEWITIFKGLFFIADFNKHFVSRTYVWSEHNPQLNFFNKVFSSFADGLKKVFLESPEFERRFIVYSDDQVDARYILTPSMMERMVLLQDRMRADIVFSFVDTKVYAAIPFEEDLFEPSLFSANSFQSVADYYQTIRDVLSMIDTLNLNLRIWNKE